MSSPVNGVSMGLTNGINNNALQTLARVAAGAAAGGTISEIGGGNFANGAVTGAYQMLFNHGPHEKKDKPLIPGIYKTSSENIGYHLRNFDDLFYGNTYKESYPLLEKVMKIAVKIFPPTAFVINARSAATGVDELNDNEIISTEQRILNGASCIMFPIESIGEGPKLLFEIFKETKLEPTPPYKN